MPKLNNVNCQLLSHKRDDNDCIGIVSSNSIIVIIRNSQSLSSIPTYFDLQVKCRGEIVYAMKIRW